MSVVRWLLLAAGLACHGADLEYRWVYLPQNLLPDANVAAVTGILERAKAAGYNGAVLNDTKLSTLDLLGVNQARYLEHLAAVKRRAGQLGLRLISGLSNPGSGGPMLAHDPNLAEGILVKDVPYRVKGGVATLEPDPAVALANGGFDRGAGNRLEGFATQEAVGTGTVMDREVRRSGRASLRMERFQEVNRPNAMVRATQKVAVKPWRQYRLTVYLRTRELDPPASAEVLVKAADGRELAWAHTQVKATQDWERTETVFPSLESDQVTVYFGVWGGRGGKVWWADAALEEAGLVNLVRRPACPLAVRGADGGILVEGRDFEPFSDPKLGNQPWPGSYSVSQPSPTLRLTPGTRIREGERLLLSGYVAKVLGDGQVAASLGDEGFFRLYRQELAAQVKALRPAGFLMGHDEIRVLDQDPASTLRRLGAGGLLAMNIERCSGLIRAAAPGAGLFVWSDMFTPTQNAHAGYYLAGGDLTGSWRGLAKDVVVLNWDSVRPEASVAFFSGLGLRQILAGYYDHDPGAIAGWLKQARTRLGVAGVMYTTWENRYGDLEAFAQAAGMKPLVPAKQ